MYEMIGLPIQGKSSDNCANLDTCFLEVARADPADTWLAAARSQWYALKMHETPHLPPHDPGLLWAGSRLLPITDPQDSKVRDKIAPFPRPPKVIETAKIMSLQVIAYARTSVILLTIRRAGKFAYIHVT